MISKPLHGWCEFHLGDFIGHPSYTTDVPMDILNAFEEYICTNNRCVSVAFDEEGSDFYLILTPYDIYIISEREETLLHHYDNKPILEIALELTNDIESDFNNWATQFCWSIGVGGTKEQDQKVIDERINIFKQKIKNIRDTIKNKYCE